MIQSDSYFSNGLVQPPTSCICTRFKKTCPVYYLPYGVCRFLMRGYTYNVSFHVCIYTKVHDSYDLTGSIWSFLNQETRNNSFCWNTIHKKWTKLSRTCHFYTGKGFLFAENHFDSIVIALPLVSEQKVCWSLLRRQQCELFHWSEAVGREWGTELGWDLQLVPSTCYGNKISQDGSVFFKPPCP